MKKSFKITLCAITAALSASLMLLSYFQYATYAVPALCGLLMILPLIEAGAVWAWGSFAVSAGVSLLLAETQSAVLYLLFLGYYPILKAIIEKLKNAVLEWGIKLLAFNTAAAAFAFISTRLFLGEGLAEAFNTYGFFLIAAAMLAEIAFVLYDIGISRVAVVFMQRIHPQIKRLVK